MKPIEPCTYLLVIFQLITCFSCETVDKKVINLQDYGIKADSGEDASSAIIKAIEDASKYQSATIKFPGGRLDIWPESTESKEYYVSNATEDDMQSKVKSIGILLENMSNITLQGNGTLIVAHGKMVHLAIDHCRNVKVNGLRFDYERPTMSEMEILSVAGNEVLVNVHEDSKYKIKKEKLIWYGEGWESKDHHVIRYVQDQETMYYDSWKPFSASTAKEIEPGTIKFLGDFSGVKFSKGDILTIRDPYRDCVGVLNYYSHQVSFDDVQLHYMHGMGIINQFSEDITLNNVKVQPRKESGRKIAAFADCFHFSGCYGKIIIENSLASGSHDDPVNVHGTHLRVVASDGDKIKVRFMHHQTWNFEAFEEGDSIGFVDNENLLTYDYAVVRKAELVSKREMELQLDKEAPSTVGDKHCIENITKTPEIIIRNNRFEHTNTRGVLLTTRRKAIIENNTFYRTGMHAILIANDCNFWYESGPVRDVTIRNNKFIECAYNSAPNNYTIAIMPETHGFVKNKYVHSNIRIENNEFTLIDEPVLFARSTNNLIFTGNIINENVSGKSPNGIRPMFFLEHCDNVDFGLNEFGDQTFERKIQIKNMNRNQLIYESEKGFELVSE